MLYLYLKIAKMRLRKGYFSKIFWGPRPLRRAWLGDTAKLSVIMTLSLGPLPPLLSVMARVADSHTWT